MGKKHDHESPTATPQQTVASLIKAGKVKKKCCKSKPRCKRCPVLALKRAKTEVNRADHNKAA